MNNLQLALSDTINLSAGVVGGLANAAAGIQSLRLLHSLHGLLLNTGEELLAGRDIVDETDNLAGGPDLC